MTADRDFVIEEVRDLDAVWSDLTELFVELLNYHDSWLPRRLRGDWQERWRAFLTLNDDRQILIARQNGAAVGYLNSEIRRDYGLFDELIGFIDDAYVRSDLRNHGIGRSMLSQAEAWCRSRGAAEVRLNVMSANELGVRFWTRSDFAPMSMTMTKSLQRVDNQ